MEVAIEERQITAILIQHIVGLHIRMIDGHIGILAEGDAIEACGQSEDTLLHFRELEVGAKHFAVDIELALLQFVGIVGEVPGHEALGVIC